jgi:gliding motility-associated-like protein
MSNVYKHIILYRNYIVLFVFIFLNIHFCFNQLNINNSKSPIQLVSDVLVGPGLKISNINFKGDKTKSIAEFSYQNVIGSNNLNLDKGIFISTGNVFSASGNNIKDSTSSFGSNLSDKDLDSLIKITDKKTTDATILEFDFVPMSDSIQFKYVFASEEYPEFNCSSFNDVFAFLLSGPDPNGGANIINKNLAIVPGTINTNVSVNTINSGVISGSNIESTCDKIDPNWKSYSTFFIPNYPNLPSSNQITFDGYTKPLIAKAAVKCGETYHLKIAIADVGDQNYDSGVFLLANSLFSNIISAEPTVQKKDLSIIKDSNIIENCTKGILTFKLAKKSSNNTLIDYKILGNSTNGVDYSHLSGTITIPANQDSVQLIIDPITDNIQENNETIEISYNAGGCIGWLSKTFTIRDNPLSPITDFKYDSLICINSNDQFVIRSNGFVKGGFFSSNSTDLNLNINTGKISPSTSKPGIYQVTYKVNPTNSCEISGQTTINIEVKTSISPNTSFSYDSPICQNNTITTPNLSPNFSVGGKFFSKTNILVDSSSGNINLGKSEPGVHKIYYEYKKNACFDQRLDSALIEILANPSPIPGFSYVSPICILDQNPTPNLAIGFLSGGIFKSDSIKLKFKNSTTGEIDLSLTPIGTYNIYYEVQNSNNCKVSTDTVFISIIDISTPKVSFNYDKILCTGSGKKSPVFLNGFTVGGIFSSNSTGLKVNANTGEIDLDFSFKGQYQIKYSLPSTNCNSARDTLITIQIDSLIQKNTTFSYNSPVCILSSNPLPIGTFDIGGEFSSTQGITISKTNGRINLLGSLPGIYEITYTIQASGCFAKSVGKSTIKIESNNSPIVNFSYERPICLNSTNTLPILPDKFTLGGKFKTFESEITVDELTGKLDLKNAVGGKTYKIDYEITSNSCGGNAKSNTEIFISNLTKPNTEFNYLDSMYCTNSILSKPITNINFEPNGTFTSKSNDIKLNPSNGVIDFLNSKVGIYEIMYKSTEKPCIKADSTIQKIRISNIPTVNIKTNNPICIGDTLKLFAPTYQNANYNWNGPDNFISNQKSPVLTKLTNQNEGIYKLIIKENNCIDSSEVFVDVKDIEKITFSPSGPFCKNDTSLIKILPSVKNGIWINNLLEIDKKDSSITYLRPSSSNIKTTELIYKTLQGCGGYGELKISINQNPNSEFELSSNEGCAPVNVKLLIPIQNKLDSCLWFIDNQKIIINNDSTIKFSKLGVFNVKIISYKDGCSSSLQKDTILKIYPYPTAEFEPNDTVLNMFTPRIVLKNESLNATKYNWFFSDGTKSNLKNPIHTFPLESSDYFITLYASQRGFCEDSKTIHIAIPTNLTVYVPNTFTPNDDKLNEEFLPIISNTIDPKSYTLTIYNRWGEVVFISHDKSIGWNGTYGGKFCVDGIYTWKIDFIDIINNKKHNYIGNVNLIK